MGTATTRAMTFGAMLAIALISSAAPTAAEEFVLAQPIDCELGKTCYIEDYVDHDPAQGSQRDFACGLNARDDHKGTDFALLGFDVMEAGVDVLAAAPGIVLRTRDEMPDDRLMRGVTDQNACGNAVLIEHQGGYETLYCHMRLGSVAVAPGDVVRTGDRLGQVGLSGQTNHPHVHITLTRNGELVDPFRPEGLETCGDPGPTLWAEPPEYTATGFFTARFSDRVPTLDDIRDGRAALDRITPDQPLVVFALAIEAAPGDVLVLSADGPQGEVFRHEMALDAPKRSQMQAFGRKAPADGWPSGEYLGEALLTRDGTVIAHRFAHVTVD